MKNKRYLSYSDAINEAMHQQMSKNKNIVVYGLENKVFGSLKNLEKKFGKKNFFYTPLSEDMLTGMSLGLALAGKVAVFNHLRVDFLLLGMKRPILAVEENIGQVCPSTDTARSCSTW